MANYSYLKSYASGKVGVNDNWFVPVTEEQIISAEHSLGHDFPAELRQFYQQIGWGMLRSPHQRSPNYQFYSSNTILPPQVIANFMQGVLLNPKEGCDMSQDVYDLLLEPGDLPFFEIGDSSRFLVMKMNSNNPNAVWHMGRPLIKVEDSFEKFIWRLYYESPSYYDDILDAWNAQNQLG